MRIVGFDLQGRDFRIARRPLELTGLREGNLFIFDSWESTLTSAWLKGELMRQGQAFP